MSLMASHWLSIDSDLVLHILYGRAVIADGLASSDPYLSGITDALVLQEWLFEVFVAWLDYMFGLVGPLLVFSVLIGCLMAGFFQLMRSRGVCLWVAILYAIFALFTLRIHLIIRPHLVSWCAVLMLLVMLENWAEGRRSFRFTLVTGGVLMLLWTNMHGGFLIGLAITLVYLLDACYRAIASGSSARALQAMGLFTAFSLVSLVNPWGWHLHEHLFAFLANDFLMSTTGDFLPPRLGNGTLPVFLLALVATLVPMLIRKREVLPREWLLLLGLCYAAATSARNIPFFGLVMLPLAANYLQAALAEPGNRLGALVLESSWRLEEDEGESSGVGWPLLTLLIVTVLLAGGLVRVGLFSENVPSSALEWVNTQPELHGLPVFADYLYAGYLLYATPVKRVYLHALNANYPASRLQLYSSIGTGEQASIYELGDVRWSLVGVNGGHAKAFTGAPCWEELYRDDYVVIFRRDCDEEEGPLESQ